MTDESRRQRQIAQALDSLAAAIKRLSAAESRTSESVGLVRVSWRLADQCLRDVAHDSELASAVAAVIQEEWPEIQRKAIERLQTQVEEHAKDAIHGHMDDYTLDGGELNSLMQAIARVAIYPPEVPDGGK